MCLGSCYSQIQRTVRCKLAHPTDVSFRWKRASRTAIRGCVFPRPICQLLNRTVRRQQHSQQPLMFAVYSPADSTSFCQIEPPYSKAKTEGIGRRSIKRYQMKGIVLDMIPDIPSLVRHEAYEENPASTSAYGELQSRGVKHTPGSREAPRCRGQHSPSSSPSDKR